MKKVDSLKISIVKDKLILFQNKYSDIFAKGDLSIVSDSDIIDLHLLINNKKKLIKKEKDYIFNFGLYIINFFEDILSSKLNNEIKGNIFLFLSKSLLINYKQSLYLKEDKKDEDGYNKVFRDKIDQLKFQIISLLCSIVKSDLLGSDISKIIKDNKLKEIESNILLLLKNRYNYESELLIYLFFINIASKYNSETYKDYLLEFKDNIEKKEKFGKYYSNYGNYMLNLSSLLEIFILEDNDKKKKLIKTHLRNIMDKNSQSYSTREFYLLTLLKYYYIQKK